MASLNINTSNELAAKLWAEGLEAAVLKKISVMDFVGKTSTSLLQWRDRLEKEPGDVERVGLRLQSSRAPKTSGQSVEGDEQTLALRWMDVTLDEFADAFRWDNIMSRIRVTFEHREEAMAALSDQLANAYDTSFFNQIAGFADPGGNATFEGNNPITPPSADHLIIAGNQATEDDLTATDIFTLDLISEAVQKAKTLEIPIRPADVGYPTPKFVVFIHPWQTFQLRQQDSRWDKVMAEAMQGGMIGSNPRITGSLGVWDDCLICENSRVPLVATATSGGAAFVRRSIFCGAQSAMCVNGRIGGTPQRMRWVEKLFDYDREMGVMAGFVSGIVKSGFQDTGADGVPGGAGYSDFATVTISTATSS